MTLLEKLSKADKNNSVTKKDGSLTKRAIEGLTSYINCEKTGKFYPTYTSGSGRFTSNYTNDTISQIIRLLGYKNITGNDSPRGGKTGDYIQVSKTTFKKLVNLAK